MQYESLQLLIDFRLPQFYILSIKHQTPHFLNTFHKPSCRKQSDVDDCLRDAYTEKGNCSFSDVQRKLEYLYGLQHGVVLLVQLVQLKKQGGLFNYHSVQISRSLESRDLQLLSLINRVAWLLGGLGFCLVCFPGFWGLCCCCCWIFLLAFL